MIPTPNYYPIEGGCWMTLRELEALGVWDYYAKGVEIPAITKISAYAALASVGQHGGYTMPSNGLAVRISSVDVTALLGEMANHGPTPNDGGNS